MCDLAESIGFAAVVRLSHDGHIVGCLVGGRSSRDRHGRRGSIAATVLARCLLRCCLLRCCLLRCCLLRCSLRGRIERGRIGVQVVSATGLHVRDSHEQHCEQIGDQQGRGALPIRRQAVLLQGEDHDTCGRCVADVWPMCVGSHKPNLTAVSLASGVILKTCLARESTTSRLVPCQSSPTGLSSGLPLTHLEVLPSAVTFQMQSA